MVERTSPCFAVRAAIIAATNIAEGNTAPIAETPA
jgi:hypothetical protein